MAVATAPVICLTGPTGVGKTALALELAEQFPVEIVSADSALVYRHMNLGTSKPQAEVLARIPHHLVDIIDPTQHYSAGRFQAEAAAVITRIRERGKVPLIVGGTLLYLRALEQGLASLPEADHQLRAELSARAAVEGWSGLHKELQRIDPAAAERIHPHDPQRIQRALEVWYVTGKTLTAHQQVSVGPRCELHKLCLMPRDRAVLHEQIAHRFEHMLNHGLVDEVRQMRRQFALHSDLPSMKSVGYRQVWAHLEGLYSYAELRQRGTAATRQLAKRQYTWLRAQTNMQCFDIGLRDSLQQRVARLICEQTDLLGGAR